MNFYVLDNPACEVRETNDYKDEINISIETTQSTGSYINTGSFWDEIRHYLSFVGSMPQAIEESREAVAFDLMYSVTGADWAKQGSEEAWDKLNLQGTGIQSISQTLTGIGGTAGSMVFGSVLSAVDIAGGLAGQNFLTGEEITGIDRFTLLANGAMGILPGGKLLSKLKGASKASVVGNAKKLTGQQHHAIGRKIHRELQAHKNLSGVYKARDPRFVTQAKDLASHKGYETWHRNLDDEVVGWIKQNQKATPAQFEAFLRDRYGKPDLISRFPLGL